MASNLLRTINVERVWDGMSVLTSKCFGPVLTVVTQLSFFVLVLTEWL